MVPAASVEVKSEVGSGVAMHGADCCYARV